MIEIHKKVWFALKFLAATLLILAILLLIIPQIDDLVYYFNDEIGYRHLGVDEYGNPNMPGFNSKYGFSSLIGRYNGAHVRFIEKKQHFDEVQRTEYVFEIIEWLNVSEDIDTTQKRISVFSEAYPLKWKSYAELYQANYGLEYKSGEEYIIAFMKKEYQNGNILDVFHSYYLNLSDFQNNETDNNDGWRSMVPYGITAEMSADEIVAKFKELIAEEKAKIEAQ